MLTIVGDNNVDLADTNDLVGEYQHGVLVRSARGGRGTGATLFALMAKLTVKPCDQDDFNWFERDPVARAFKINNGSGQDATDTTLTVDDGAGGDAYKNITAGDVLYNKRTQELVRVTADPASANIVVTRGYGDSTAAAMNDNDDLTLVTKVNAENSEAVTALYEQPDIKKNYIQIFKSTLSLSNSYKGSVLRSDLTGPDREATIQALERICKDIEGAFLMGTKSATSSGNKKVYATSGIYGALLEAGLTDNIVDANGTSGITLDNFTDWVGSAMQYGSEDSKLMLAGRNAFRALSKFAQKEANGYRVMERQKSLGLHIYEFETPEGTLNIVKHPVLDEMNLKDVAFIVDLAHIVQRTKEKLFLEPNIQNNGKDGYEAQFRAKLGLGLEFAQSHAFIYNFQKLIA